VNGEDYLELVYLNKYRELKAKIGLKMELKISMIDRKQKYRLSISIIRENIDKAWTKSGSWDAW
jgi:hypothetical protein